MHHYEDCYLAIFLDSSSALLVLVLASLSSYDWWWWWYVVLRARWMAAITAVQPCTPTSYSTV